jgi:predicted RNA methylase
MKLKHLEELLQGVRGFASPSVPLEQVITSPHLAARMMYTAHQNDDIESLTIGDFGCGTGMLSVAGSFMGCTHCVGIDVDAEALSIATENFVSLEITNCDLVMADLQSISIGSDFDTIVSNPPFGTRNKGIDSLFIDKAMAHASVMYSLHKSSTRDYFLRKSDENDWKMEVIAEMRYDLPKTHKFHKQKSKDIEVDLYRFSHSR